MVLCSEGPTVVPPPLTLFSALLAILVFAGIAVIGRSSRRWTTFPLRCEGFLASSLAPVLAGLGTVLIVCFVWRSLHEPGVVHDERAYLLQAEIFSRGHWTAISPPLAAFFEQMHVFIEPAVFAKYPPAHALTLVPGIWLGLPGLMPVVLAGLSGMLIFWLARRLANEWTALLTWWLWTTAWVTLYWSASYFSEATSTAMWLVAVVGDASLAGHEPCSVSRVRRCRARVGHHGAAVDDGDARRAAWIRHCPPHDRNKGVEGSVGANCSGPHDSRDRSVVEPTDAW